MRRLLLTLPFVCFACSADTTDADIESRLDITPAESQALLALLNAPATTVELLDLEIGLDRRAAVAIIGHRNGTDGNLGTADDHRFDTLEEVESVKYVGVASMQRLHDWVLDHPVPAGALVEGVEFTADEAASVLWGVNSADVAELDIDVALSSTAARSLVEHAPYASLDELAAAPNVGKATLLALRGFAPAWGDLSVLAGSFDGVTFEAREAADALELANHSTFEDLVGLGVYATGAHAVIDHRPYASLADVAAVAGVGPSTMQALKAL
ncbi:MAG: hypothetical protein IPK74_16735 [Deltaproteobacteria bacterium]|nr:hypothetical protein [Deltaproteobacteria bacterium]